mgnify:CR=1 FL=1
MKISNKQLKEMIAEEISLMKMGDEHYQDYDGGCGEPTMEPEIGIAVDDEPCGCPDMMHYHDNEEGSMARSQLMHMKGYAESLIHMIQDKSNLPEWVEKKITLANDYIAVVKHYLEGELAREQGMLEEETE